MNKYLENLASYVSENNPRGVNKIAYKHGFIAPLTQEGREGLIFRGVMEEGEIFLKDIADIHPDRDLILSSRYALNADGSTDDGASVEPNIIDVRKEKAVTIIKDNSDVIKFIVIIVLAFVFYKIMK